MSYVDMQGLSIEPAVEFDDCHIELKIERKPNQVVDAEMLAVLTCPENYYNCRTREFAVFNGNRTTDTFRLPCEALGIPRVVEQLCTCGQAAMPDSDLCADCRTIAEDVGAIEKPEPTCSPRDDLGDWKKSPCGTVGDKWRR